MTGRVGRAGSERDEAARRFAKRTSARRRMRFHCNLDQPFLLASGMYTAMRTSAPTNGGEAEVPRCGRSRRGEGEERLGGEGRGGGGRGGGIKVCGEEGGLGRGGGGGGAA